MKLPFLSRCITREAPLFGTLVCVTLADIDIAVRSEGEVQRLPEQPSALGFIPNRTFSLHVDGLEEPRLGTEFHHGGSKLIGDPDIVLSVDSHAVRLDGYACAQALTNL